MTESAQLLPPALPTLPSLPPRSVLQPPEPVINAPPRAAFLTGGIGCVVCSRKPAMEMPLRTNIGLIVVWQTTVSKAILCRDHGVRRARSFLIRTLLFGWWGVISLFLNPFAIRTDLIALKHYKKLAPPQGVASLRPNPFRATLFGSRVALVTLRWIMVGSLALAVVIIVVSRIVGLNGR